MNGSCAACATPLGSRDRTCPGCGAAVRRTREAAVGPGRQVLIDAGTDSPRTLPTRTASSPAARSAGRATATPRRPRRTDAGPAACGTVTGEVMDAEIAAVGRRQWLRAVAAAGLAIAALLALLVLGGGHRGAGLALLLPTFFVTAVLVGAPFLIPRSRSRSMLTHFDVTAVSGTVTACELLGAPTAAPPRTGELVEVFGRGTPVRAAEIVRDEERFRGRTPAAFLLAHHAPTAALALSVVCAVIACALAATA